MLVITKWGKGPLKSALPLVGPKTGIGRSEHVDFSDNQLVQSITALLMGDNNLRPRTGVGAWLRAIVAAALLAVVACSQAASADRVETRVKTEKLPSEVIYQFSRQVGPGRVVKGIGGSDGYIKRIYFVKLHNGLAVSKKLVNTETKKPVDTVMLMGKAGFVPSRSSFKRGIVKTMIATGYDPSPETIGRGATGYTCTGRKAEFGCIAVDPRVIPFGTLMYVEGYGFGLACDRGSAIKGNRIDLCFKEKSVADAYGKRPVKVHILKNR